MKNVLKNTTFFNKRRKPGRSGDRISGGRCQRGLFMVHLYVTLLAPRNFRQIYRFFENLCTPAVGSIKLKILSSLHSNFHNEVESSWNVMAHGDAREGKWRGNWRMEWVASTPHTTSEHGVSSITTADAHTSAASSRTELTPPADLNGLVRFDERQNLVSARVPSRFNWPISLYVTFLASRIFKQFYTFFENLCTPAVGSIKMKILSSLHSTFLKVQKWKPE